MPTNRKTKTPAPEGATRPEGDAATAVALAAPAVTTVKADPTGKLGALVALLRRPGGARIDELTAATGWQTHSVRGAMSGTLKKKLGLAITSDKTEQGRVYRIPAETQA